MTTCPICNQRIFTAYQRKGNGPSQYICVCYGQKVCRTITGVGRTQEESLADFLKQAKPLNQPREQQFNL